jgi:hypothetical protein
MSGAKLAACCGVAAISLSACGATKNPNPPAGSVAPGATRAGRAVIDDPRVRHVNCLKQHHIASVEFGHTGIQVDTPASGPTIVFTPSAGAAQAQQIEAQAPGAEVIGAALLYPNSTPEGLLQVVENCVSLRVKG